MLKAKLGILVMACAFASSAMAGPPPGWHINGAPPAGPDIFAAARPAGGPWGPGPIIHGGGPWGPIIHSAPRAHVSIVISDPNVG
jgi:hypothetical protein